MHYHNELWLVDSDADACFELVVDDLFMVVPVVLEGVQLLSIAEFVEAQRADSLCGRLTATAGEPGTQFDTNKNGILVRRASIDGSIQKFVSVKLRQVVLYDAQNPVAAAYPGSRRTYDPLRRAYY